MKLPGALPHLNGARGAWVRAAYLLVALPTILAVLLGLWFVTIDMMHNVPATMRYGFRTFTFSSSADGHGHHIGTTSAAATKAGLRYQDRIVAIDGVAVREAATEFEVGDRLAAAGPVVTLVLRDRAGVQHSARLTAQADPWQRIEPTSGLPVWAMVTLHLLTREGYTLVLVIASLLLFRRRPRDPEALLFAFALMLGSIRPGGLWWWAGSPFPGELIQAWWATGWICSFIAIAGFPDGRFTTRLSRIAVTALVALLALNLPSAWMIWAFGRHGLALAVLASLNLVLILSATGAGVAVVQRYRRTPAGPERQQIKWAVGGFCVTLGALLSLVLAEASGLVAATQGSPVAYVLVSLASLLAIVALPIGLIISLLRYRLYDAEATISRSALYAALTLSLLAIFAGSEKVIEALGEEYFGGSLGALAGGIGAALAAVMIAPLHHRLSEWSEHRFQHGLIRLRKGLPLLVADLRETAAIGDIAQAVLKRVEAGVRARHAALLVGDDVVATDRVSAEEVAAWCADWVPRAGEGLDCARDDARFPLRVPLEADGCGRVGWILLGPRPDGSFFGKEEREALADIADPVARAIAIVRERGARQEQLDARIGRIEAALERMLKRRKPASA